MRIFTRKPFARFQRRERIADAALTDAVRAIAEGRIDADLGGGLIKQRIARRGQGRRGGYRVVIAYRHSDRAVFLYGFAKSDRDNMDDDELEEFRRQGRIWLSLNDQRLTEAIADKELREVSNDEEDQT